MAELLAKPENTLIHLISKSFDEKDLTITKPWYFFNYSTDKYPDSLMQALRAP